MASQPFLTPLTFSSANVSGSSAKASGPNAPPGRKVLYPSGTPPAQQYSAATISRIGVSRMTKKDMDQIVAAQLINEETTVTRQS